MKLSILIERLEALQRELREDTTIDCDPEVVMHTQSRYPMAHAVDAPRWLMEGTTLTVALPEGRHLGYGNRDAWGGECDGLAYTLREAGRRER